ncbi:MAG: hypothetical protein CL609_22845 [Anaerolineaceae bacterium]|nr:hypothetical protein [Anaerolineaceae bacterium]
MGTINRFLLLGIRSAAEGGASGAGGRARPREKRFFSQPPAAASRRWEGRGALEEPPTERGGKGCSWLR